MQRGHCHIIKPTGNKLCVYYKIINNDMIVGSWYWARLWLYSMYAALILS